MSGADRDAAPGGDERIDAKLAGDAESAWLHARRGNPEAPPPSPALAREHAELEDILGNLPSIRVENSWHDEVLRAAIRADRRVMRRRWAAALLGVAAVAGMALLISPLHARAPELTLKVVPNPKQITRSTEPSVGDQLVVMARADADTDLRVYYGGSLLLARCPGDARCAHPEGSRNEQTLKLTLDALGDYDVILVVSAGHEFPDASMEEHLGAVITAKASYVTRRVHAQ